MFFDRSMRRTAITFALLIIVTVPLSARADGSATRPINGELRQIQGVPVLRVWGTPNARGYAQGYFLGDRIVRLLNANMKSFFDFEGGTEAYEAAALLMVTTMKVAAPYQQEMEGIVEGAAARLVDGAKVPLLGRTLAYRDLVTINCLSDMPRMGCSSFAAWGKLTKDGKTIAGRNLDWHRMPGLEGEQVVVVYLPDVTRDALGWVSITWPGVVGCLTGMNAEGVTLSIHDVHCDGPTMPMGLSPRGMALREALEHAEAESAAERVMKILRSHAFRVGGNMAMALPAGERNASLAPSVIFECDPNKDRSAGVSRRTIKNSDKGGPLHLVCTNHHRKRTAPYRCDRYCKLDEALDRMEKAGEKLDVSGAWKLLQAVAQPGTPDFPILTHHSVVFEPDRRLMHVAFSTGSKAAPICQPIDLDVAELLAPRHVAMDGK